MNDHIKTTPTTIIHNGIEFVSVVEAAKRLDVSIRTIVRRVRDGQLKPYRIPGLYGCYGKPPHFFRADDIRKLMP